MKKRLTSILMVLLMLISTILGGGLTTAFAATKNEINDVSQKCGNYIYSTVKEPVYGNIGGEWVMYGLAQDDYPMSEAYISSYQKSVEKAVTDGYRGVPGQLHDRKYTDYSRVILAYSALGLDPTNIAGYNMVEKLADFDGVVWQGINGPIWALRALDSGKHEIPKVDGIKNVTTRQKLIDYILNAQLKDGGWNLNVCSPLDADFAANKATLKSDPDLTGMALAALAPYKKQEKVKKSIDKAVTVLSKMQNSDGTYTAWDNTSSESVAQVICGLTAVGIDPNTDARFKKSGHSLMDGLLLFYDKKTGGFRHVNTATGGYQPVVNQMATEQAYYALAAYKNTVPEKTTLSKVSKKSSTSMTVTWKKAASVCSGYQVVIAQNSKFSKGVKKIAVSGKNAVTKKITGLTKGKTYYVKVRAYKTVNGTKVYGAFSIVKKVAL